MKVLILGSTGFIGKNLSIFLKEKKNFNIIFVSKEEMNLLDLDSIVDFIQRTKPNIVINAAFIGVSSAKPYEIDYVSQNLQIVSNVLTACKNRRFIKKIIHLGSCTEYSDSSKKISEKYMINPKNFYGSTKAMCTLLALQLQREFNLPLIVLRPFYLYGPHDKKSVLFYLIDSLISERKFILTKGEQVRDYLYIKDFCKIIYEIIDNYTLFRNGEIYNIASGSKVTLNEMFEEIFFIMGKKPKYSTKDYAKYDYKSQFADIKKLKSKIIFPRLTPIKVGIQEVVRSLEKEKMLQ